MAASPATPSSSSIPPTTPITARHATRDLTEPVSRELLKQQIPMASPDLDHIDQWAGNSFAGEQSYAYSELPQNLLYAPASPGVCMSSPTDGQGATGMYPIPCMQKRPSEAGLSTRHESAVFGGSLIDRPSILCGQPSSVGTEFLPGIRRVPSVNVSPHPTPTSPQQPSTQPQPSTPMTDTA
eukprot:Sspe_Gene.83170::Locus_54554_Transcript_1_1_Confidence_1.000_Length_690::g.83170::m.83170